MARAVTSTVIKAGPAPDDVHERAACRGEDLSIFFPRPAVGVDIRSADPARKICKRCPVRIECLEYALAIPELHGVWGGYTAAERREERKRRKGGDDQ